MGKRGFSNSTTVAKWRYIQSIHERAEFENPDRLVGQFLPILQRLHSRWISRKNLALLQNKPFYSYLIARTKYYDRLFLDAIDADVQRIMNVGCGLDSRSGRFEHVLSQKCITVLECDLPEAISLKQSLTKGLRNYSQVAFASIDLNDDTWPDFDHWLTKSNTTKSFVFMEGVSPYIDVKTFPRFLRLLGRTLAKGSRVAYDFKLRGIADGFGRVGRTQIPFRLGGGREEVAAFHEELGYQLVHMERSSELSIRLLPCLEKSTLPLFTEDALIQLEVM